MAEQLSSYDKINHPNIHTRNREAQSARTAESKYPENGASQHRPLSCGHPHVPSNGGSRPSNLRGQNNSNKSILMSTYFVDERRTEGDEAEAAEGYRVAKPDQRQSTSSSSNSITSSSNESASTGSTSAIRTLLNPKNTEIGDTSRHGVRFSDRGPPRTSTGHPTIYRRSSIGAGPVVEWGTLFDENGYATTRNNQFLRGLAKYIIDDLAPSSNSLVITPEKLSALYSKYRLNPETYPFIEILNSRARDAHDRLADFFTDLDCQYHLVQPDFYSRPRIPALTPAGFAQYFTICILAHPDEEFRRLDKIVADVQLVADTPPVDGEPERFPRQLFRSQFPVRHDPKSKKILTAAIDDLIYDLRLPELPSPRSPLAIMPPPPSPSTKDRSIVPIIRRHAIPEEYTRRDEYKPAANSEAGQPFGRHLQGIDDEKSSRALPTNRDREPYYERERNHYNKGSSDHRLAPSGDAGSIVLYSPKCTYQRVRSPPPRGHRASAPDVSSASTSYFRPAGYLPQPPLSIAERRQYAMSLVSPGAAADNGDREEARRRGQAETEQPLIEASTQMSGNEGAIGKAPASSPTTATNIPSTPPVTTTTHQQQQQQHSHRDSNSSRKGLTNPAVASSDAINTVEKKHHHGHGHTHSHSHGHHQRRNAVEDDKGPTWEEVLKSPSSSHHHRHHHHHHHHHRTESSGKGASKSLHSRRHSTY
ncbi:hypothetical protein F4814DRAFT_456821 [Daldinia grandis]|nr:hypothetical protein F4814DRAFT_456821 [Daldinia grandis]